MTSMNEGKKDFPKINIAFLDTIKIGNLKILKELDTEPINLSNLKKKQSKSP